MEQTYHEVAAADVGSKQAGQRLEQLAHGGVSDHDDTPAAHACLEPFRTELLELTCVRLENLPVLLWVTQIMSLSSV